MPMRTSALLRAITGGMLLAGAVAAHASNYGFLSDTPMSYMHQRDIDSLLKAANTALDTKRDGETAVWTNESTGSSVKVDATLMSSQTIKDGDRTCRRMTATLNAKRQSMTLRPEYCKTGDGAWQFQKQK
jgi:surface antigen